MTFAGGFIAIINYGSGGSIADDMFAINTENSLNILTETNIDIEVEH